MLALAQEYPFFQFYACFTLCLMGYGVAIWPVLWPVLWPIFWPKSAIRYCAQPQRDLPFRRT